MRWLSSRRRNDMGRPRTVVKVGGSLYDLPDLRSRLQCWLLRYPTTRCSFRAADRLLTWCVVSIRRTAWVKNKPIGWRWRAATQRAFPGQAIAGGRVVDHPKQTTDGVAILNAHSYLGGESESHSRERLPHCWSVTSDAIAARAAIVAEADRLVLLKSVTIPPDMDWEEAAEHGYVDEWFARTVQPALPRLQVSAVNLRDWRR